ncbi:PRP38-domain-containing protein [Xylariaceae sp. FL0255]|nr:PRP38-domain-containing protein [Xylariaceae sp. FL0255]
MPSDTHRADERRFLDERGSSARKAPNGLDPATIMEKAVVDRIVDSLFWKDQCFGVNEADIVDRVVAHVNYIGGVIGDSQRPSPFLCLAFKLLQLAPGDKVVREYLGYGGEKFKYLRALACFYVRLTRKAEDVYKTLEPFLEDKRKVRRRARDSVRLGFVDEFVDDLLVKGRVCGTSLWTMPKRVDLEDRDVLEPRVSPLGDILDLLEEEEGEDAEKNGPASDDEINERRGSESDEDEGGISDRSREERRRRSSSRGSSRGSRSADEMDVGHERRSLRSESR